MENGKRLVGILKHSILINAPGPQTLFANSVVVAINVPGILTFSIYLFFFGGGGGIYWNKCGTRKKRIRSRGRLFARGQLLK